MADNTLVTKPGDANYPLKTKEGVAGSIEEIRKRFNKDNLYEDPDFPPTDASIGVVGGDTAHGEVGKSSGQYNWLRPHEICIKTKKGKPNFAVGQQADCDAVGGRCSALDIRQGSLGDCGWLTAMAAVSRNPEILNIVIPLDNYDGFDDDKYCGAFHFRVYDMQCGNYADIVVDDLIPCSKIDNCPEFANPFTFDDDRREIAVEFWIALAEKAFAKYRGAYKELESSHSVCNLELFTGGFDADWYMNEYRGKPEKYNELHSNVKWAIDNGHSVLLFAAKDEDNADGYEKYGLASPHAYAVLDGTEVKEKDGGPTRFLLKARNPWGHGEWKGSLNDQDDEGWSKLESDLRRRDGKGSTNIDEGVFWIDLRDVIKYFKSIEYCAVGRNTPGIRSEWPALLQEKKLALSWTNLQFMPVFKFTIKEGAKPTGKNGKCNLALQFIIGEAGVPMDPLPRYMYYIFKVKDGQDLSDMKTLIEIYKGSSADKGGGYQTTFRRVQGIYLEPGNYIISPILQTDEQDKIPKAYIGKALPFSIRLYAEPGITIEKIN